MKESNNKVDKVSRDPITGYATVEILGKTIVLQKDAKADFMEQPANEVVETCLS